MNKPLTGAIDNAVAYALYQRFKSLQHQLHEDCDKLKHTQFELRNLEDRVESCRAASNEIAAHAAAHGWDLPAEFQERHWPPSL